MKTRLGYETPDYVELNRDHFRIEADEIVVGCANFILMGRECPTYMRKGHTHYQFASLEALQPHHAGQYCSVLRYKRIEGKGEQRKTFTLAAPRIEDYEAYAELWGCEPAYDRWPNQHGDGCLFYNYRAEQNDPKYLARFIPAIERTIKACYERRVYSQHENTVQDLKNLRELLDHVKKQLNKLTTQPA